MTHVYVFSVDISQEHIIQRIASGTKPASGGLPVSHRLCGLELEL